MLERVRKRFINNIKKSFLDLTDMKVIKKRIEKRGYTTSRVYGHKNVKRLSAYDSDKNRIEFILSDKNLYIIFSLSFSNRLHNNLIIVSTNKDKDFLKYLEDINLEDNNIDTSVVNKTRHIFFHNASIPLTLNSPSSVYHSKGFLTQSKRVIDMWAVNLISITRDRIIEEEIDIDKLPFFSEIKGKNKDTFIKNIAHDTISMMIKGNLDSLYSERIIFPQRLESIYNKTFYYGFIFYKYLVSKYRFTDEEIESFFRNEVIPYILKNRVKILKKESASFSDIQKNIFNKINDNLFKDMLVDADEDKSWFQSINSQLQIAHLEDDVEINF